MSKAATKRKEPTTAVTLGWVVKKRYRKNTPHEEGEKSVPKWFDKVISKMFSGKGAADQFRSLAEKYNFIAEGEHDVSYYVTEAGGHDDLPVGL